MKWELAIIATAVLAVAGVSGRLTGTIVTPPMVFVLTGVFVGPLVIDEVTLNANGATIRTLARGDSHGGPVRGRVADQAARP